MKASLSDLRRDPGRIIDAIERNETVVLTKKGCEVARIIPGKRKTASLSLASVPAFGMWKDRADMENPTEYVRRIRNRA